MPDALRTTLADALGPAIVLGEELGGGAMARVFRARDAALGRDIVVKVLAPDRAGDVNAERFRREIAVAASLVHPQVVPVLAAGDAGGMPWYTMPYVAGASLAERLAQGAPLARGAATSLLRDVARALAAAHAAGVVHRDVKPGNVLLVGDAAVVTDFGIAKAVDAARTQADDGEGARHGATLTRAGMAVGTPAYMAPEQAAGDAVDARADVYAWGVLAYEVLAGRHPFAHAVTAQQALAAHLGETPAPLGDVAPQLPPALAALVMRALAKEPAARFADGRALLAAIDAALSGDDTPTAARGTGRDGASTPLRGPSPRLVRGAIVLAVLALGAEAVLYARGVRNSRATGAVAAVAADSADATPLLAVLPFDNAGVVADSSFADGLGEAITHKLARLGGLRVIDRASVLSLREQAADPRVVGRELGAQFVLRATVRWAKGEDGTPRVQVTPVVVRTTDGTTRWSGEPIEATPTDPFAVQATVASRVVDALDIAIAAVEREALQRPPTTDVGANTAYQRGLRLMERYRITSDPAIARAAGAAFDDAIARDPRFSAAMGAKAEALLGLALSGWTMGSGASVDRGLLDSLEATAARALAIDPGEWRAAYLLAGHLVRRGYGDSARVLVERAIAARPSSGVLQTVRAEHALYDGDTATARDAIRRAMALAPRTPEVLEWIPFGAYMLRDSATALGTIRRALVVAPGNTSMLQFHIDAAESLGDTVVLDAIWRAFCAAGGTTGPFTLPMLRHGTQAMRRELDTLTLAALGATTPTTRVDFHLQKGLRARELGDEPAARRHFAEAARFDAGLPLATLSPNDQLMPNGRRAWVRALAGDTAGARRLADSLETRLQARDVPYWPYVRSGLWCRLADVRAALADADGVVRSLEPCLTGLGGLWPARLRLEPGLRPYLDDPRLAPLLRAPVVRPDRVRR